MGSSWCAARQNTALAAAAAAVATSCVITTTVGHRAHTADGPDALDDSVNSL